MRIVARFSLPKWNNEFANLQDRVDKTLMATANMLASMLVGELRTNIENSGNFGSRWINGLSSSVDRIGESRILISISHAISFATVFMYGATISGNLWIPLSGTDAVGVPVSQYPGGVFGPRKQRTTGAPLLFSMADKRPKYFGVGSVTIPQKWQFEDAIDSVMGNFRDVFSSQWRATEG